MYINVNMCCSPQLNLRYCPLYQKRITSYFVCFSIKKRTIIILFYAIVIVNNHLLQIWSLCTYCKNKISKISCEKSQSILALTKKVDQNFVVPRKNVVLGCLHSLKVNFQTISRYMKNHWKRRVEKCFERYTLAI